MPRRFGWIARAVNALLPTFFLVLFGISGGIGLHSVLHLTRAQDVLARDAGCTHDLRLTTPATDGSGCRIVHGAIVRAYEIVQGAQYNGGLRYQHHFIFVPQSGATVDVYLGEYLGTPLATFQATQRRPGRPAVVEYVDGEIDYVANEFGTIGPVFDPQSDKDTGWFLIGLGAFFAIIAAGLSVGIVIANKVASR